MSTATYPVATVAKLLLLTERRVQQLTREGVLPKADRGRYELAPVIQAYVKYLRDRALPGEAEGLSEDFQKARARRTAAEASMAEMRAAQARGELIPAADVHEVLTAIFGRVRSKLLALPSKLAPRLLGVTSVNDAQEQLKAGVYEALSELAATRVVSTQTAGESDKRTWRGRR
jgi:phage terminase Nu1 subunit (DNA packaging protein)